jgi:hypothetical protein
MRSMRFVFLLSLSLVSCSVGYVGQNCSAQQNDISTEGSGRECKPPIYFKGTKQPGEACSSTSECAPTCCGCANGNGVAWAAACENNVCLDKDAACCRYNANSDICRRGPSSASFHTCNSASDCDSGMACIVRYQVTSRSSLDGAVCELNQRICTKRCTQNSDCTAYDGACSAADACDGANNLCHNK